ncbi:MAG: hypothetical protein GWN55_02490, partial [Phycisphaerae bacterium]|nr:hypothetical protein [candidate division KSB1 bacterium]NIV00201.1 hypothetical protein [Phycisphaerae bacterium]NIW68180.1 hypothetical protein [candidate division KSB1 bacterium]NIX69783.1 hypothetical protein [candidate division KSB1 bacterium]
NGKSIVVRINDRGPYAGEDRIIDLSKAAFEVISPLSRGVIPVKVEETLNPVYTPPPEGSEDGSDGSLTVTDGPNGGAADEPTAVDAPDLNAT